MPHYLALLRAINVGGRRVKMAELRRHFEALDFTDVQSYRASGNVVFRTSSTDPAALENRIEAHLESTLGFDVPTMLRTAEDLTALAAHNPFADEIPDESYTLYITFLKTTPTADAQASLLAQDAPTDSFHIEGRHVYWLYRRHLGDSAFLTTDLERILNVTATRRGIKTVRGIAEKYFS